MNKKIIIFILLICFVFGTIQAQSRNQRVQQHITKGQEYLNGGKFNEAIAEFEAAIQLDQKNKQVQQLLSDAKQALTRYARQMINLGINFLNNKQYDKAIEHFDLARNSGGLNASEQNDLGRFRGQAWEALQRAEIETRSSAARELINKGIEFLRNKQYSEAIEQFDLATNSGILNSSEQNDLGRFRGQAWEALQRAEIETQSSAAWELVNKGREFLRNEQYSEAIEQFDLALNHGGLITDRNRADVRELRKYAEEERTKQEKIRLLLNKGIEYYNSGQYDEAIIEFSAVLKIDSGLKEAQNYLSSARDKKYELEKAEHDRLVQQEQARGHIRLWSAISGTVLVNDKATEYIVTEGGTINVTIENAAGNYTLAVRNSSGTVVKAVYPVNINRTGTDITYETFVLDNRPLTANTADDFTIIQNAQGGITITAYKGTRKQVVIPETLYNQRVTIIGSRSFEMKGIVSVVIPNSITLIEKEAFLNNRLIEVIIPPSVTKIEDKAFNGNILTRVTLGRSLTIIGTEAFRGNRIESLIIPNGVTAIGYDVFRDNTPLTTLVIPPSLANRTGGFTYITTGMGDGAFTGCPLTHVTLPENMNDLNTGGLDTGLLNFYKGQGKKAGTYIKDGPVWRKE